MMPFVALALLTAQPQLLPVQLSGGRPPASAGYPGLSGAGNAILQKTLSTPDPVLDGLLRQQRGLHDALTAAATAPTPNVDQVAGLLRQRADLQAQFNQRLNERLVAAMRQLSPADRSVFLRGLVTPANPGQGGMPPR